jgi:hypothetical protein
MPLKFLHVYECPIMENRKVRLNEYKKSPLKRAFGLAFIFERFDSAYTSRFDAYSAFS